MAKPCFFVIITLNNKVIRVLFKKLFKSCSNVLFYYLPPYFQTLKHEIKHSKNPQEWVNDRYFFLHIPKSAGTSLSRALGRAESGHFTFQSLKNKYDEIKSKEVYFFIARDPKDRIISTYNYINGLHSKYGSSNLPQAYFASDLNDFIENKLTKININKHYFLRPFSEVIKGADKRKLYAINFNGLNENLKEFYSSILNEGISLPHLNKSSIKTTEFLSPRSIEIVEKLYKNDYVIIEKLGMERFVNLGDE